MGRSPKFRSLVLLSTLLIICIIAVTATWFGVRDFKTNLLKEEALNDAIHWAKFVASRSDELTKELESGEISQRTRTILDIAMGAGNVIRYDLYNSDGFVVHASRKRDVGHKSTKSVFSEHVAKGEAFARIVEDEQFEKGVLVVSEAYVPVMQNGQFHGAIEVFVDETEKATELDKLTRYVFSAVAALVLSAALIWSLFVAFDMKSRHRLEAALLEHRDQLQKLVVEATKELQVKTVELENALSKEKELNEFQSQFVSMASHEFRTPLAIIDGTAQRIKSKVARNSITPEDIGRRADKIRAAVDRMKRLMESTLAAARMQEGKIQLEINSCEIGDTISDVCAHQREFGKFQDISHELIGLPKTIQADCEAVEQIINNLVSNAVKYTRNGTGINVKAFLEDDSVVVSVHDHGIGIDEDDLPRIGERFFRAKTSTGTAGTGIGLNLVKTLVEMHEGSFSFKSVKDEGSIFTIRLPVAGPQQSDQST